jgi:hypothetical protein
MLTDWDELKALFTAIWSTSPFGACEPFQRDSIHDVRLVLCGTITGRDDTMVILLSRYDACSFESRMKRTAWGKRRVTSLYLERVTVKTTTPNDKI